MDFICSAGRLPLLVSMPHAGQSLPDDATAGMTPCARMLADTDWHLPQLYAFASDMGASTLAAHHSRYVIDLNRPPENSNLYPGMDTTALCPVDTFACEPLYEEGRAPQQAEIERRLARYWQPYHAQLRAELDQLLALHGAVVLWEAHSIASHVPRFFSGRLPDLNFGTASGAACAPGLLDAVLAQVPPHFSKAVNGRFKGGYITRRYGQPATGVHAIQLEMCQCLYMNEPGMDDALLAGADRTPFAFRPDLAQQVQPALRQMLEAAVRWVTP